LRYSRRLDSLPQYPFAKLDSIIREKKRRGVDLISFGIGDPDLPPPEFVNDELRQALKTPGSHNYPSSEGESFFRKAVAEWYRRRFHIELNPDSEVCALIGSKEGIANVIRAFVNPGEIVLTPNPSYPVYEHGAALLNDAHPRPFNLGDTKGFRPDLENIAKEDFKFLFLNYPNNPTAAVVDKVFLQQVSRLASEKGGLICYDNAYSELTFKGYKAPSILQVSGGMDVAIEFHSCSKTFSMAGYRIGFAAGNSEIIKGLKAVKSQVDSGPPKFIQHAAARALLSYVNSDPPKEVLDRLSIYEKRFSILINGLKDIGYNASMPLGTFYLWLNVGEKSESFASKLLEKDVVVTPGTAFGSEGDEYVRFSLTVPEASIEKALVRIQNAVR